MDTNEPNTKILHQNSSSPIIYRPKAKKLCISYKLPQLSCNKKKNISNNNYCLTPISNTNFNFKNNKIRENKNKKDLKIDMNKKPKLDFDEISIEEIEKDFTKLKAKSEVTKVERELLYLLRNSTKDNSVDDDGKDTVKIKRPKNPFLKNLE